MNNPVSFCIQVLGTTPHPDQARWLLNASPVRVLAAGRRSGKSWTLAAEMLFYATVAAIKGEKHRQFVVAPTVDQCRVIFGYLDSFLRESPLGGLVTKQVQTPFPRIELGDSAVITARSAQHEGRGLRGWAAERVVVDEAAFIPDGVVADVLSPMLADTGGSLTLASTPWGKRGAFYEFFLRGQEAGVGDRYSAHRFPSTANPYLDAAYLEAQQKELPEQVWRTEYLAEFADERSVVFSWEHISAGMVGREEAPQETGRYLIGWDPARYQDRSAVVVLRVDAKPLRAVMLGDLAGQDYVEQIAQLVDVSSQYNGARVVVDQTAHGDPLLSMLRARGVQVDGVKFSQKTKSELIFGLVTAMERRALVFPPHRDLLDELKWYQAESLPSGGVKLGAPTGANHKDDYTTALALACWGCEKESRTAPVFPPILTSQNTLRQRPDVVRLPGWFTGEPNQAEDVDCDDHQGLLSGWFPTSYRIDG